MHLSYAVHEVLPKKRDANPKMRRRPKTDIDTSSRSDVIIPNLLLSLDVVVKTC